MPEPLPTPTEYLFVYGTLRFDASHPLAVRLRCEAVYLGPAFTQGQLVLIGIYPGLICAESPAALVRGDLFSLPSDSDLLQQLDDYEECSSGFPAPTEYLRIPARVTSACGRGYTAWLYLYNRPCQHLPRIESGDFLLERARFPK